MTTTHRVVKPFGYAVFSLILAVAASSSQGAALTAAEIQQIETEFGITLSAADQTDLAAVVKPDAPFAQWRVDANARIEANRKADLDIQVEDSAGNPVEGAQVAVKLKSNDFKFGGTFSAKDFAGVTLPGTMTTQQYKDRLLSMFNSVGLNNGFKPRLTGFHSYIPGVLSWAQANNLPVRGHLLIWPGTGDIATMDTPGSVPGTDYGKHLSQGWSSAYANGDVLGAVETWKASARGPADDAALEAEVDAEILNWVSQWNVYEWDVINETLNNYLLQEILGADQMAEWFKIAESNKVAADCKLLINDYQIISAMSESRTPGWYTDRRDRYMANINQIISDGGQIDRIGFQSRIKHERRDPQLIYDRLEEWGNAYGLEMTGTEFEVVDSTPGAWKEYIYTEDERAQITEEMMMQYYSHPLVTGFNAWDTITDDIESLVDYSGNPNLNGLVWYYVHRIRYNTDTNKTTDVSGVASIRGFKGDYDITVSYGGNDYPATLTLSSNQTAVVVLNDVTVGPALVPLPTWVAMEEWTYTGVADGTVLNGTGTESTTGTGTKWANKAPFGVVSNQMQRWAATGAANEAGFNDVSSSPYADATGGVYQLSYDVVSADFSNTEAVNGKAQFGYGIRDTTLTGNNRNGMVLVRYDGAGSANRFRLSVSAGSVIQQDIATGSSISNLHVRAVYDLDNAGSAGSFIGYFSVDGGPETAVTNSLASGFTLKTLRMQIQALNGGNSWQVGDVVTIDNIVFSQRQLALTPESYYAYWLTDYPGMGSTNLTDNPDGDAGNNLYEYAFGGDPTNGLDVGHAQSFYGVEDGGSNYVEYVYAKRLDAAERGLTYTLELNTNLVSGIWANTGYTVTGSNTVDSAFQTITNRVPTANEDSQFIRLQIEFISSP
jgi:GH35 family endo-1,4-beta-xylanase